MREPVVAVIVASTRKTIVTRADLLAALARRGEQVTVSEVIRRDIQTADATEMIEVVFQRLQTRGCHTIPVLRRETLIRLITMENGGEFVRVQAALESATATVRVDG